MIIEQKDRTDTHSWVGSIITASGIQFDVLNPQPYQFEIHDIARALSHICRYNGHLPGFYSVAEHSFRVSEWLDNKGEDPIICLTGLLHDAAEAYIGDMVRPIKRLEQMSVFASEIEPRVTKVLHQVLGGIYPYPEVIHEADKAIYDWEVNNIRTGIRPGWEPSEAFNIFLSKYTHLKRLVDPLMYKTRYDNTNGSM